MPSSETMKRVRYFGNVRLGIQKNSKTLLCTNLNVQNFKEGSNIVIGEDSYSCGDDARFT